MYLSQGTGAFLFTIIRLVLQVSAMYLISHLASRTRNLTYQERINGGFLSSINYLFFTRFSPSRPHYDGRFYVALALVITLALNYLPTLLSDLYPVVPTFRPSNLKPLDISTAFVKTTELMPNKTSVEDILFSMGVPLNGSIFDSYVAPPTERLLCRVFRDDVHVHCSDQSFSFGGQLLDKNSLVLAPNAGPDGLPRLQNGTTHAGEQFQYYNATNTAGEYALAEMFVRTGEAESDRYNDMLFSGSRSLGPCLTRGFRDHRCVRHSLGYLFSDMVRLFLITRRVYTLTFARDLQTFDTEVPHFIDPSVNTTLDCGRLPTPTLETMCNQINSLGAPPMDQLYSMQKRSVDQNGRIHWDVVSTMVGAQAQTMTLSLMLEAFHLDVGAEYYNTTLNGHKFSVIENNTIAIAQIMGRETFEATYFVPNRTVGHYNHSWVDWGFSQEDVRNLNRFLIGGTLVNNGTLMMRTPELLANVSNLTVALVIVSSLVMVGLGWFFSRDIDSAVCDPITEVLPMVLDSMLPGGSKEDDIPFVRYRRVANLTLLSPQASALSNLDNDGNNEASASKAKTFLLRMEIDNDDNDDINSIELSETTAKGYPPASPSVQGQSSSTVELLPGIQQAGRLSIFSSVYP